MAAAAVPSSDLVGDMLVCIYAFLPCRADRVHMASVNHHWRAAVTGQVPPPPRLPALPPQLPWLIFPSAQPPTFYSELSGNFHPLHGLPADVSSARCCGSGGGGWLLLEFLQAPHAHEYALYNLSSGRRVPVPRVTRSASHNNAELPLHVQHATFPASQPEPNADGPSVVGAIARVNGRPTAAFWCPGNACWFSPDGGPRFERMPEDVIPYRGGFVFLTPDEQLVMFGVVAGPDGNRVLRRWNLNVQFRPDFLLEDIDRMKRGAIMKNYLVESRGQLLMAVRYVYDEGLRTTSVQISRMITTINGDQQVNRAWHNNVVLDGRVLFLGPGCSRCFELAPYNGVRDVADDDATIYFLDETGAAADTGRFSQNALETEPWPPAPGPSTSEAPPTWWFH